MATSLTAFTEILSAARTTSLARSASRFVELYMRALDTAGMPADPAFRTAVREHVEFGSRGAHGSSA